MKQKAKVHAHGKIDDAPSSRGTENPTKLASDSILIKMVPVSSLQPNGWNPNVMSEEDEVQFANEVRRLGQPPKPIVVRKREKGYQIVRVRRPPSDTLALTRRACRDPGSRVSQMDERGIHLVSVSPAPRRPGSRPPAATRSGLEPGSMSPSVASFQPSWQGGRTESPPRVAAWRPRSLGTSSSPT